jgi:Tol biopolymer transport system component/DNA-binding winged helix-turn-helix (wHTH) protein
VDLSAAELRKRDRKVMLQEQPFQVLALLLRRPGEAVTREELQQALWPSHTFVEFDQGLNKAIQKIRQALGDSPDNPRFIETLPRKGYRFIAPVERLAREATRFESPAPDIASGSVKGRHRQLLWMLAAGIVVIAGLGVAWWWLPRHSGTSQLALTQLTTDTGLTYQPALSPDGKLVAYASDRAGEGNLDIWVQQIPRGEPIRVTHDGADDHEPSFSPNGRSIVFRSERSGGGIYVVPALGGEPRKIAAQGRQPRYSPDGTWIAYWVGPQHQSGALYVVPSAGGQPKQLFPVNIPRDSPLGLIHARSPVWAPDGKHVLFRTYLEDWYVVPLDGGPVVKTGVMELLRHHGFSVGLEVPPLLQPDPDLWLAEGNFVVFSGKTGDSTGLWKISISPKTWAVDGEPHQLAVGAGVYSYASAATAGRILFSSLTRNPDVWSVPIQARRVTGEMQQLTHDAADDLSPSVSADGKRMAFESNRSGKRVVWTKDLETGKEKALTDTPSSENLPLISADGSEVTYVITSLPDYKYEMYETPLEGGPSKKICDTTCVQAFQWSSEKNKVLVGVDDEKDPPPYLAWLDVRTGEKVKLLRHTKHPIWGGALSPDKNWISFAASTQRGDPARWFIAPLQAGPASENTWIPITGEQVRWSTDANLLYITSEQDGFPCLYAQRLDPQTKRPAGPLQPVHHFHSARRSMIEDPAWRGPSVARDKIVVTLVDLTGNIWMAEPQGQ